METDPKRIEFWTPANLEAQFRSAVTVPVEGKIETAETLEEKDAQAGTASEGQMELETCRVVYPSVEIGTYRTPADLVVALFVYATITRHYGREIEWRGAYAQSDRDDLGRIHQDIEGRHRDWMI